MDDEQLTSLADHSAACDQLRQDAATVLNFQTCCRFIDPDWQPLQSDEAARRLAEWVLQNAL